MCGIAEAAVAMSIIGAGTSVAGGYQQSQAQADQARYAEAQARLNQKAALENARRTDENARRADQAGRDAESEGADSLIRHGERVRKYLNAQRDAAAANGISLANQGGDDTIHNFIDETRDLALADQAAMRRDINRQAFSFYQQGDDLRHQANNLRQGAASFGAEAQLYGAQAGRSPLLGLATESLLAGSNILGNYSTYKEAGMFGNGSKAPSNRRIRRDQLLGPR